MERRTFLKNIFGAAVVAAMPPMLVRQIEELPPEKIAPRPNLFVLHKVKHGNCMYLHDGENLVATSRKFNLVFENHLVPIGYDMGYPEYGQGYPEYGRGYREWKVWGENVMWVNGDADINHLMDNKPLYCLIYYDGLRIVGQVYITECSLNAPMYGTGELIIDTKEDSSYEYPRVEKQIREAEGSKITNKLKSELFKGGHKRLKA